MTSHRAPSKLLTRSQHRMIPLVGGCSFSSSGADAGRAPAFSSRRPTWGHSSHVLPFPSPHAIRVLGDVPLRERCPWSAWAGQDHGARARKAGSSPGATGLVLPNFSCSERVTAARGSLEMLPHPLGILDNVLRALTGWRKTAGELELCGERPCRAFPAPGKRR